VAPFTYTKNSSVQACILENSWALSERTSGNLGQADDHPEQVVRLDMLPGKIRVSRLASVQLYKVCITKAPSCPICSFIWACIPFLLLERNSSTPFQAQGHVAKLASQSSGMDYYFKRGCTAKVIGALAEPRITGNRICSIQLDIALSYRLYCSCRLESSSE
jgi:hypothetical protein